MNSELLKMSLDEMAQLSTIIFTKYKLPYKVIRVTDNKGTTVVTVMMRGGRQEEIDLSQEGE